MTTIVELTPHDPLIARDGRPFGAGQGNRMRGLPWLLPSVVAGSFRTALVKAHSGLNFTGDIPKTLLEKVRVAGVFPVHDQKIYLPAPNDCAYSKETKQIFRSRPEEIGSGSGCDLPDGLRPVMLDPQQVPDEFKAETAPAWWPIDKYTDWLLQKPIEFNHQFLLNAKTTMRDHVKMDVTRGAAEEGQIFASANLNVTHLPRFGVDRSKPWNERYAPITMTARVTIDDDRFNNQSLDMLHPLGGERRLVHWKAAQSTVWECPALLRDQLKNATHIRMVLATPAIFKNGWKPDLQREPFAGLNLVGVSCGRWKAISGWSLAPPIGPKAIRRMVPAGSVYFFECNKGAAATLADFWLTSVCDNEQDQRDGFGLALWGTW